MEQKMLAILVFGATLSIVISSPLQQNAFQSSNNDNIQRCLQPMTNGLCLAYIPSYYYDSGTKKCESFIYGGCGGNGNRFFSIDECMTTCNGVEPQKTEFKLNPCSLPSEMGPCRASMPRFYYNGNKCDSFIYGGCEGNENNFKSIEDCQQQCVSESTEDVQTSTDVQPSSQEVQPSSENAPEIEVESKEQPQTSSEEVSQNER